FFFFSSRRRHTRCYRDWSSDVCFFRSARGKGRGRASGVRRILVGRRMGCERLCARQRLRVRTADADRSFSRAEGRLKGAPERQNSSQFSLAGFGAREAATALTGGRRGALEGGRSGVLAFAAGLAG